MSCPGRPGLAAEARRVGRVAQRQVGLVEDLVAVQRRERHLGGRDGPQVVALDVVRLVDELRQVAGRDHRLGAHEGGRPDLLVGVGVAVEAELHEGAQQAGAPAPVHGEHRARDLGGPLEVEEAELGRRCPSAAPAGARRRRRRRSPRCAARRCRPRRRRRGRRRSAGSGGEQQGADLVAEPVGVGRRAPSRRSPSSRLSAILASASSVAPWPRRRPTSFDTTLTRAAAPRRARRRGCAARRRARGPARRLRTCPAPRRASAARDRLGLGADASEVEHGGRR